MKFIKTRKFWCIYTAACIIAFSLGGPLASWSEEQSAKAAVIKVQAKKDAAIAKVAAAKAKAAKDKAGAPSTGYQLCQYFVKQRLLKDPSSTSFNATFKNTRTTDTGFAFTVSGRSNNSYGAKTFFTAACTSDKKGNILTFYMK